MRLTLVSHKIFVALFSVTLLFLVCSGVLFSSTASYQMGTFFFGKIPFLYNVEIAQFFFNASAYPRTGNPVEYAHYQLSRTLFIQGEYPEAVEEIKRELAYYPENTRSYYILGLTYGYMDREFEAIKAFEKFLEFKPESWAARNDKAWLHFRVGDVSGGLATILPAAEMYPENPWVMNTYGVLLMNSGEYDTARNAIEKAAEAAAKMTPEIWGMAYPGNAPEIYGEGLGAMRSSIQANLELVERKRDDK